MGNAAIHVPLTQWSGKRRGTEEGVAEHEKKKEIGNTVEEQGAERRLGMWCVCVYVGGCVFVFAGRWEE